jgi:hypothetical protein
LKHFLPLILAATLAACSQSQSPKPPPTLVAAPHFERLIVAVDRIGNPRFEETLGKGAAIEFGHFARRTEWVYIDELHAEDASNADAVVYFGLHRAAPARGFAALYGAKRLIVLTQHLRELRAVGLFASVRTVREVTAGPSARVEYGGRTFGVNSTVYKEIATAEHARTLGAIVDGKRRTPFAIVDGSDTFVNAPLSFGTDLVDPYKQGSLLAACDVLRLALSAPPGPKIALLRLEDVSVQVPTERMRAFVEYLAQRKIPYGIGLIPDQLIKGQQLRTLKEDPELVGVLRFAQDHGARIVLHGLHHSFNSPEDFEFWDAVHDRPLPEDSEPWMREKIEAGLRIERDLGLQPVMWESPHYAASPLDYGVVGKYFPLAWERRRPVAFAPWALTRDAYGSALLPENLGYIATGGATNMTARLQLERAADFTVCGDCIPAGFLHPATVELDDLKRFVDGIERLGYRFADPLAVVGS